MPQMARFLSEEALDRILLETAQEDLPRCARVSLAWADAGARELYRAPLWAPNILGLAQTLEDRPDLARHVRDLSGLADCAQMVAWEEGSSMGLQHRLLSSCLLVRQLSIVVDEEPGELIVAMQRMEQLQALSIHDKSVYPGPVRSLALLVPVTARLTSVTLSTTSSAVDLAALLAVLGQSLREFRFIPVNARVGSVFGEYDDSTGPLLPSHSLGTLAGLRRLSLRNCRGFTIPALVALALASPALESLDLPQTSWHMDDPTEWREAVVTACEKLPSLVELDFGWVPFKEQDAALAGLRETFPDRSLRWRSQCILEETEMEDMDVFSDPHYDELRYLG